MNYSTINIAKIQTSRRCNMLFSLHTSVMMSIEDAELDNTARPPSFGSGTTPALFLSPSAFAHTPGLKNSSSWWSKTMALHVLHITTMLAEIWMFQEIFHKVVTCCSLNLMPLVKTRLRDRNLSPYSCASPRLRHSANEHGVTNNKSANYTAML